MKKIKKDTKKELLLPQRSELEQSSSGFLCVPHLVEKR